jgi:excisionase family DNA binding protein
VEDALPIALPQVTNNNEQCVPAASRPVGEGVSDQMFPKEAPGTPAMNSAVVADYLPNVPRASVYKLAQQGRIPCQKMGRHWRFRREAVDVWLENALAIPAPRGAPQDA